jgi:hypothetical protein
MPKETAHVLRKEKFLPFARATRGLGYEVDNIAVRGLTDSERLSLSRRVYERYRHILETTFGVPLHDDNVEQGSGHIRQIQGYYVAHSAANFSNLEALHRRKLLQSFALREFVVEGASRFSKGTKKVGIEIHGDSFASDRVHPSLYDKSKPQDYQVQVIIRNLYVRLQPELSNLFEGIPQVIPSGCRKTV